MYLIFSLCIIHMKLSQPPHHPCLLKFVLTSQKIRLAFAEMDIVRLACFSAIPTVTQQEMKVCGKKGVWLHGTVPAD